MYGESASRSNLGWIAAPKPGYTPRQTGVWQLLKDQISTCHPLARLGADGVKGQEKVLMVVWNPKSSTLPPLSVISSHPDFKGPLTTPWGPVLSPAYPLKTDLLPWARGLWSVLTIPQGSRLASTATLQTSCSHTWVWSKHSHNSLTFYSLSFPWSFGNWNLLWCQKVADNIKCIPLSWCRTLLNLQQHKYHKNYKNCKLTTDFLVQWHK